LGGGIALVPFNIRKQQGAGMKIPASFFIVVIQSPANNPVSVNTPSPYQRRPQVLAKSLYWYPIKISLSFLRMGTGTIQIFFLTLYDNKES